MNVGLDFPPAKPLHLPSINYKNYFYCRLLRMNNSAEYLLSLILRSKKIED